MKRVLIGIPHVFAPVAGSIYSSQNEAKRSIKQSALYAASIGNLVRHRKETWIHASLGKSKPIITRAFDCTMGVEITIQIYTPETDSLAWSQPIHENLKIILAQTNDYTQIPTMTSRSVLEQANQYDMVGYMEDDLAIEDPEFFTKILSLLGQTDGQYALIPHRCEQIPGRGDVVLSGDPDGGRPDLYWDTGETITFEWPTGQKSFYRATNPHSGCYFLSRKQAQTVLNYWEQRNWQADFVLSGPLEQAGSGLLLPVMKLMKPIPAQYRFLMVRHQDSLWERHPFETPQQHEALENPNRLVL